ncbi:uncharacterized protein DS421_3g86380 [Arachis hypogaea]|nr:uncharacterized protein DS421_3g86380 [Arachis hypogaea]
MTYHQGAGAGQPHRCVAMAVVEEKRREQGRSYRSRVVVAHQRRREMDRRGRHRRRSRHHLQPVSLSFAPSPLAHVVAIHACSAVMECVAVSSRNAREKSCHILPPLKDPSPPDPPLLEPLAAGQALVAGE